eukprot:gene10863-11017_t
MAPKKVVHEKVEAKQVLTAVLLADSFTQRFRPITVEKPKVLLPLVNVPLLEYTLEWLALNRVEEIIIFCCAHADQIKAYLADSKWLKQRLPRVTTVTSTNCFSLGEAMRSLDQKDIIKSTFVLVSGDTVSNMDLRPALAAHKERIERDKDSIMTMGTRARGSQFWKLDAALWSERDSVQVRSDLLDTHIAICSPEVLMMFSDNFDYQTLKRDFVVGTLSEEELGKKIYLHILEGEYAARIHNLRSYDAVSRDLMGRWAFPFVPDTNVFYKAGPWGPSSYRYARGHNHSVIGRGCTIGKNCRLHGCYLQGVVVSAGATVLQGVVLSYGVVVGPRHTVPPYVVVSLCKHLQHQGNLSDDELEYSTAGRTSSSSGHARRQSRASSTRSSSGGGGGGGAATGHRPGQKAAIASQLPELGFAVHLVGEGGAGYEWPVVDAHNTAIYSIAPPPMSSSDDAVGATGAAGAAGHAEGGEGPRRSGGGAAGSSVVDQETLFMQEVGETFLRCVKERFDQTNAVIELNGLKIAEDRTFADCARYIFTAMLQLCLPCPGWVSPEYRCLFPAEAPDSSSKDGKMLLLQRFKKQLNEWAALLQRFLRSEDDQVELLLTLEEFCGDEGEAAITSWAAEKEHADEDEKVFLHKVVLLKQ